MCIRDRKYFILIREWFREAQATVPEHIEETIYHLGQGYAFVWQNVKIDLFLMEIQIQIIMNLIIILKDWVTNLKMIIMILEGM